MSDVVVIRFLCDEVVGVLAAKLVMSSRMAVAWFGAAVNSSFDTESWSELPPCSGETSISCISMSLSWKGMAFPFISDGWLACWLIFTPSSSSLESAMRALLRLPLLDLEALALLVVGRTAPAPA